MRRTLRILRIVLWVLSLLLFLVFGLLCLKNLVAPGGVLTDLVTFSPYPDRWFLYARGGTLLLVRQRTILDPVEARGMKPGIDERSLFGFGRERSQELRDWPVHRGTITYGIVLTTYFCPLWSCFVLFLILPLIELSRMIRNFRRRRRGWCMNCGYDLRASPDKCPECGIAVKKQEIKRVALPKRL